MIFVNISEAKANLSYYIDLAVKKNEVIMICNHNVPVAELRAIKPNKKSRVRIFPEEKARKKADKK